MDDRTLGELLLARVEDLGGIVELDGEQMVDKMILRGVVEGFISEIGERLTAELSEVVAGDPEAVARVPELVAAGIREIEKKIKELLPVLN